LIIEYHDGMDRPTRARATRLLVRDEFGQPVALFVQNGPREIVLERAGGARDEEFKKALAMFGVAQTAIATEVDLPLGDIRV
jgi:hypothetical protein